MKKKVAVVMGGYSSEYAISLKSGQVVCQHLDKDKYEVFPVHIFKDRWIGLSSNGAEYPVDRSDFSIQIEGKKIQLKINLFKHKTKIKSFEFAGNISEIDAINSKLINSILSLKFE